MQSAHSTERYASIIVCWKSTYHPASRGEALYNVHKLRRSSILLMRTTTRTLILETNMRKEDRVIGLITLVRELHAKIEETKKELDFVNQQLKFFKEKNC